MPPELALDLRNLSREYYDLMDNRSAYINKLQGELRMVFSQYLKIFSKVTTNTSLTLLEKYTSPDAFLLVDNQEIIDLIRSTARFGLTYANEKYHAIIQAAEINMSKHGSRIARRVLHTMALISISKSRNGSSKNPILREYYLKKCEAKPKIVALGAVMHKVCNIVFAILRDEKEFKIITPEEHQKNYLSARCNTAA